MAHIRLVAIDLDGTLVTNGHHIPQRCMEAIRDAQARGVHIILATGRMHHSAAAFAEQLGLGDEPIISYNGALVRRAQSNQTILHVPLTESLAQEVLDFCIARRGSIHYFYDDIMYVLRMDHWARSYWERTGSLPVPVGDLRKLPGREPTKILVIDHPERAERHLIEAQTQFEGRVYVTRSLPEYIEFLSYDASKGNALRAVAQYLNVPLDQTMGLGDMINDQPLIEVAGLGVAMHHSPESVKAVADYVTGPGDEGVAEAIAKWV
ncbi:MAG: Cof-type HAD-IIB family hydrolase [Candidatus Zipacnadales bacterium]